MAYQPGSEHAHRGPGRPPLPKGEARTEFVKLRVSPKELADMEAAAKSMGKDFAAWARDILVDSARRVD